jgi:hypothetical protein
MTLCCLVRRFIDSRPFRFRGGLGLGPVITMALVYLITFSFQAKQITADDAM